VGDWCAKIWVEEGKTPILSTSYHEAYLTGGCWSPSRPGVFFLTRADGKINVWDYNLQQQSAVYEHKVHVQVYIRMQPKALKRIGKGSLDEWYFNTSTCGHPASASFFLPPLNSSSPPPPPPPPLLLQVGDHPLKSISVSQANSRLLCVGDSEGTVTLLQVTKSLSELVHGEKPNMGFMFEREALQEKNLMLRDRDLKKEKAKEAERKRQEDEAAASGGGRDEAMENLLREVITMRMITDT